MSSPRVSVLTASKRTGWEELARKSLAAQTYQDFEWIIVSERPEPYGLLHDVATVMPSPEKTQISNLNASQNKGLRHCNGELLVFYQDFIELEPDTLGKLVADYDETKGFVTTACISHEGKMDIRYSGRDEFRPIKPEEYESNLAIAPMQALRDVGGFDERLDAGWAWDSVLVARKAELLGYGIYIDETIKPRLHYHPTEQSLDPDLTPNGERCEEIMRAITQGKESIKTDYLL